VNAAIDCGTNSFRLLIADDDLQPVLQVLRITRLGEGVHEHRVIQPQAMQRALDALQEFRSIIDDHDVSHLRATATSAARDATNGDVFLARAKLALGVDVEILSGVEEGRLTYEGVAQGIDAAGPLLVVDIGGGSTEFSFGIDGELQWAHSLQIGSVRLTELELHEDPYSSDEIERAKGRVSALLAGIDLDIPPKTRFVGVAGTVTSVAMIAKGIAEYKPDICHELQLSAGEIEEVAKHLAALTNHERLAIGGLTPGRADVITAGAIILDQAMKVVGATVCTVSERDLLFGLLK
jgi:exopolyphosphatase/guanosine-5'-triphosphate,3'-diphosphate pyrophosphatase